MPKSSFVNTPSTNADIWLFKCPCGHEFSTGDDKRRHDMLKKLHFKRCEKARTHVAQGTTNFKVYGCPNNDYAIAHT